MNRIQTACYCLIASAFVLAGLLIVRSSNAMESTALAEMHTHKDYYTMLTTEVARDNEVLFVIDSKNETLLAYQYDPNRKVNNLMAALDLAKTIELGLKRGGGAAGGEAGR